MAYPTRRHHPGAYGPKRLRESDVLSSRFVGDQTGKCSRARGSGAVSITNRYYEDSTNTANTVFTYKIKAVDGAANESGYSSAASVTTLRTLITSDNFNRADEATQPGTLTVRSNTLQLTPYVSGATDWVGASSQSSFRASVSILSRNENTDSGIGLWGTTVVDPGEEEGEEDDVIYQDHIYRVGEISNASYQRLFLEYCWYEDQELMCDSWVLSSSNLPPGPGTLTVDATSSTRRIKAYWNGVLQIDYTETDTSRPNSGTVTLWTDGGSPVLDDFLVEQ